MATAVCSPASEDDGDGKKKQLTPEQIRERTRQLRIANRYRRALIEADALESFYPLDQGGFAGSDAYERFWRDRDTSGAQWAPAALPQDRKGGRKWPLWFTDLDLQRIRQASRILCSTNDFAKALLRNSTNYVIGTGMDYQVGPKEKSSGQESDPNNPDPEQEQREKWIAELSKAVQSWIEDFSARNNWNTAAESDEEDEDGAVSSASSTKEREVYWRVKRDGEAFLRLFCHDNGKVEVRFVGPEMIWGMPPGKTQNDGWFFGVQHRVTDGQLDLEKVVAYYVRPKDLSFHSTATDSERDSIGGEIVPAREMIHIKDPWEDAEVARGTPAFSYDCLDALLRASSLQKNMSISANVRAATAEVWKHTVGTAGEIRSLQNASPGGRTVVGADGSERNVQPTYPGMIRRIPQSQEPVPFPTTTNIPEHQTAMQGDLRQAASGFCAPEYMTGTTNESNYATAREAGTPFVNAAEAEQEHYKTAFMRLMWRVIRWAVKCQKLPQEALTLIKISVEASQVKKDNEGELASARNINLQNKITSPQIEAAKIGNDPKQVVADWKKWATEMPGAGSPPGAGGMPGQPGQEQAGGDPNNPLAGVPQEDLSGQAGADNGADAGKHIADPKRSLAAKQAWAKRAHQVSESVEDGGWFDVSEDILEDML